MAMVAYRLVPGASLAFERGSERKSPGCDPCDNALRYESPSFNGFKFGVSGIMKDAAGDDDTVDEFSFGVKYESPIGITVGAGYEVENVPEGTMLSVGTSDDNIADNQAGFRFGARYGQDNWLVAYEYRTYEGYWNYSKSLNFVSDANVTTAGRLIIDPNGAATASNAGVAQVRGIDWNPNVEYEVHAFGVQVKIDRITASANYSTETQSVTTEAQSVTTLVGIAFPELGRDVIAVDAAYSLGSRSTMVVGWKSTETDSFETVGTTPVAARTGLVAGDVVANGDVLSNKVSEVYLFYRVDF